MPTNFKVLYGPIFRLRGVSAHLVPRIGVAGDLLALDDTSGVEVEGAETLMPVARVRYQDLVDLTMTPEDLDGGTITLNGRTWKIDAVRDEPTASGLNQGLAMLVLQGV